MKIAYLTSSTFPDRAANTINVMRSCRAFAEAGHEVTLMVPQRFSDGPDANEIFAFYGIDPCFEIQSISYPNFPGGGLLYAYRLGSAVRKVGVDIAYGRFVPGCYFAQRSGVPTVLESHKPIMSDEGARRYFYRKLIGGKNFVRQVVISESLRNWFVDNYPETSTRLLVAHNASDVPPEKVDPVELPGHNPVKIGYLGHLYPGKGGELISELVARCPWADFHVVGGNEKNITIWKERLDGSGNAFFHGFIPPGETEAWRQSFDVLLAPYQRQVAGHDDRDLGQDMPLKIFEYMASGRAIVCSDLDVIREVLTDDENAKLCPPEDVDAWVETLKQLADDPVLRQRLGNSARESFLAKHTWEQRCQVVLEGLDR